MFLDGRRAPAGLSYVANLDTPLEGGNRYALSLVASDMFEELALGRGLGSEVTMPEGLTPPKATPPAESVIVYKTTWCCVCKKVMAFLDREGVPYVARDIEKDVGAAAELKAKSDAAGVRTGSVPVIDVRGELMVGFDRARLQTMLAAGSTPPG